MTAPPSAVGVITPGPETLAVSEFVGSSRFVN
jgi:hypothetical protein